LVLYVAELVEVFIFTRGNVNRNLKQSREEIVEEGDQRRLTAEVQLQRLLFTTRSQQDRRHLAKHVNVCTAETVDRLLTIADDEEIRRTATFCERQTFEQHTLYGVRVLKFVDEKKPVALRRARNDFWSFQKLERTQFEIVKIERREFLFLLIESLVDAEQ